MDNVNCILLVRVARHVTPTQQAVAAALQRPAQQLRLAVLVRNVMEQLLLQEVVWLMQPKMWLVDGVVGVHGVRVAKLV